MNVICIIKKLLCNSSVQSLFAGKWTDSNCLCKSFVNFLSILKMFMRRQLHPLRWVHTVSIHCRKCSKGEYSRNLYVLAYVPTSTPSPQHRIRWLLCQGWMPIPAPLCLTAVCGITLIGLWLKTCFNCRSITEIYCSHIRTSWGKINLLFVKLIFFAMYVCSLIQQTYMHT